MYDKSYSQAKLFPRARAKYLHTFGRRSTGEILYAFGRGRRSTRESINIYIYILGRKVYDMLYILMYRA